MAFVRGVVTVVLAWMYQHHQRRVDPVGHLNRCYGKPAASKRGTRAHH